MKSATALMAIALLVAMAGCKSYPPSAPVGHETRRARLVEASRRSAAYADSVCGITPEYTTSTERKDP